MTRNLINILLFTAIAAVLTCTLLATLLVLDFATTIEARTILTKSLLVVAIIAIGSMLTLVISWVGKKNK